MKKLKQPKHNDKRKERLLVKREGTRTGRECVRRVVREGRDDVQVAGA